jgi:2-iminobutanoate/2-iminopropanoate deaminase
MDSIQSPDAPLPVGPYVQAIRDDPYLFCSGQVALDPKQQALVDGDIETQTRQVLTNLKAVLVAGGCSLHDVVKTTVFLKDMDDFATMNRTYEALFDGHKPARSTVQVGRLPLDALVEIECIARIPS